MMAITMNQEIPITQQQKATVLHSRMRAGTQIRKESIYKMDLTLNNGPQETETLESTVEPEPLQQKFDVVKLYLDRVRAVQKQLELRQGF